MEQARTRTARAALKAESCRNLSAPSLNSSQKFKGLGFRVQG